MAITNPAQVARPLHQVALVAVVDGNANLRSLVADALVSFYRVNDYSDATRAIHGLRTAPPNVLLIDEETAPHGGFEFVKALRQESVFAETPIIITSKRSQASLAAEMKDCGVHGYLGKPYRRSALISAITALQNKSVEDAWNDLPETQRAALKGTVEIFNNISDVISSGEPLPFGVVSDACMPLVEAVNKNDFKSILNGVKDHDNYSYAHSMRVATLLTLFGHAVGLKQEDQLVLASGGLLHDAGKISIPHEVLNKPGKLDEAEFTVMKSHVTETIKFLNAGDNIPKPVIIIGAQHHEKLNGTGYPFGLKGAELNELARMAAIVDVFSALTDRRVYKPAMPAEKALSIMTDDMGPGHLDQHFLKLFKQMLLDAVI